ncbi:MAG: DUF72 domain-containing protein [Gemmatimonadales bacterium]|nr:DUF72 domain-containing protein [Gemmatimonadales bacterium]NIN13400.1 DUF72 domain-containing protein [Gemmatimonadales bacterium]NIN51403.1 DUF72 domain-containing protein [Gemmatimonadales bacterium]NIP08867.1 DUF72 domain-containing protein [Gemmatimonadales bacterium]
MAGRVLIGTSGFVYPHWRKGVFYPRGLPQKQELEYFASKLRTVELNSPFYRLPEREAFVRWRQRTPTSFCFAVKASRYITHIKRLRDCGDSVVTFFQRARGLGKKLGPVLFQIPPNMRVDVGRLDAFLDLLRGRERCVLEVRHPSWLVDEVHQVLKRHRVAFCLAVGGSLELEEVVVTAPFAYVRMHSGAGSGGNFTKRQLKTWAGRVGDLRNQGTDVYVYFNNDWEGHAVRDAMALEELLGLEH